jgi:hypothetical protein
MVCKKHHDNTSEEVTTLEGVAVDDASTESDRAFAVLRWRLLTPK